MFSYTSCKYCTVLLRVSIWRLSSPLKDAEINKEITSGEVRALKFHGRGYDLFSIFIINVLLIIATLGVYYFWGKVKIKRYLYSQLEFDGDRFTFHGKGKELFIGGIIGLLLLGLTIGAQHFIETSENNYLIAGSVILFYFYLVWSRLFLCCREGITCPGVHGGG